MTKRIPDVEAIQVVVENYSDSVFKGDVENLRLAFHPDARLTGYIMGELMNGPIEDFFEVVRTKPAPSITGEPHSAQITHIHVNGNIATVILTEDSYMGLDFVNHFQLIKENDQWSIVSKVFNHDEPPAV